ncbi:D-alanyl-D-alanine carboxypeptidase/D-alanyl-D-alanine-endopeptidase [Novosphingobium sp. MW5]|nr:D-alanyl-D-alanine carboxypeptidase/D-alanyl-D-alanine-endopeptidase [Novosphingobium sp. MW5]
MRIVPIAALAVLTFASAPVSAQETPQQIAQSVLAGAGPGTRFGVVVMDDQGREVVSIDPEGRYIPASNTKLFTTAAAFWKLEGNERPDQASRTSVYLVRGRHKAADVVLYGRGDARLSSAPDCKVDCLSTLADAIAAKTKVVGDVIGDATMFPDERWSPGMSWNNIPTRSGTGIAALTLDDNEEVLTVAPTQGNSVIIANPGYFRAVNDIEVKPEIEEMAYASLDPKVNGQPAPPVTNRTSLEPVRMPGSKVLYLTGTLLEKSEPQKIRAGVDDPADRAAWKLAKMLAERGVKFQGKALSRYAQSNNAKEQAVEEASLLISEPVAETEPGPLEEDFRIINKDSQNLHAELLLRRLGRIEGTGSIADGQKVVTAMLTAAGLKPHQFSFSDGSGMSTYNRIAPRGAVTFLRWTQQQPWGAKFRETLPIGGVDGTLAGRFRGTALQGRIFAKTGTINATNALAGWFTAKSGRTYTFAAYANDVPAGVSANRLVDAMLVKIAESQ